MLSTFPPRTTVSYAVSTIPASPSSSVDPAPPPPSSTKIKRRRKEHTETTQAVIERSRGATGTTIEPFREILSLPGVPTKDQPRQAVLPEVGLHALGSPIRGVASPPAEPYHCRAETYQHTEDDFPAAKEGDDKEEDAPIAKTTEAEHDALDDEDTGRDAPAPASPTGKPPALTNRQRTRLHQLMNAMTRGEPLIAWTGM